MITAPVSEDLNEKRQVKSWVVYLTHGHCLVLAGKTALGSNSIPFRVSSLTPLQVKAT